MLELASSTASSYSFPQPQTQQSTASGIGPLGRPQQNQHPPLPPSSPMQISPMELSEPEDRPSEIDRQFLQMVYGHRVDRSEAAGDAAVMDVSSDSAVSSTSGRAYNVYADFKDYVRGRRQTITSRLPINRLIGNHTPTSNPPRKNADVGRKTSVDSQFFDDNLDNNSDDEMLSPDSFTYRRRFSVPEKALLNANYAILRKSIDRKFEIVGAFHKNHTEAYRNFLQSLSCYDLAPQHGCVILLDASMSIHKAVTVMCLHHNTGHRAAIICNALNRDKGLGIFTISDCLRSKKKLTTVSSFVSVWDVSKLFRLNRVHRIPVYQADDFSVSNEILSFICLRAIFVEIIKLLDSRCSLPPSVDFHCVTVGSLRLGTWTNIAWISSAATCETAIAKLLARKVSSLPILDEEQNLVGIISKDNIIEAIAQRPSNYLELMDLPVESVVQFDDSLKSRTVTPENTIEEAIRTLVSVEVNGLKQCLFVVRDQCLLGVMSYADIMDYLLNANSMA
uniref:CBS domain-containing protein n=1 Tax=Ditylenchus dipsaci TaxID=166011 RepID=A0A915CQ33_9BILA